MLDFTKLYSLRHVVANLWVIRHAKSSWADRGLTDFERPLNERGLKDGERMVRWMRKQDLRPQWLVSSDARRARATAAYVRDGYRIDEQRFLLDHRLYEPTPESVLDVLRELPPGCPSVALVGHNPGFSDFVNAMVGAATIEQLPTFGIAVLEAPLPWVNLRFGLARLVERYTPKGLRQEES
jgi:phosphohistidine phosphatase